MILKKLLSFQWSKRLLMVRNPQIWRFYLFWFRHSHLFLPYPSGNSHLMSEQTYTEVCLVPALYFSQMQKLQNLCTLDFLSSIKTLLVAHLGPSRYIPLLKQNSSFLACLDGWRTFFIGLAFFKTWSMVQCVLYCNSGAQKGWLWPQSAKSFLLAGEQGADHNLLSSKNLDSAFINWKGVRGF